MNHEAWAIPYGDLVTLLLAFFVVMYAISSLNEGKYKVMSESLAEAFGGPPATPIGETLLQVSPPGSGPPISRPDNRGAMAIVAAGGFPTPVSTAATQVSTARAIDRTALNRAQAQLREISRRVEAALQPMIDLDLVSVRRSELWLEIEIKSDLLFASGAAAPSRQALEIIEALGTALVGFANPLRVEGHTDNLPIATAVFPSNWELSAARAASVVRLFMDQGIDQERLAVIGYGETRPLQPNDSAAGRDVNRRVVIVVLASEDEANEGLLPGTMAEGAGTTEDNGPGALAGIAASGETDAVSGGTQ